MAFDQHQFRQLVHHQLQFLSPWQRRRHIRTCTTTNRENSDETDTKIPWRRTGTCVDYQVFVCGLPALDDSGWESAVARMRALGRFDTNACGITTVRGDWGFFQIPVRGFPELKVTFFQTARKHRQRQLLDAISDTLHKDSKRT